MSGRGRGGRYSNPRRGEGNYDSREQNDNRELEEFVSVPELNKKRDRNAQMVRLHVTNISPGLSEVALRNLFSEFGNPTIFLNNSSGNRNNKCWAFVDFSTPYEASNAISSLNKQPPHHLCVKYARTADENSETEDFKKEVQPCNEREFLRGKGRGAHVAIMGRSPKTCRSMKTSLENYGYEDQDYEQDAKYSFSRFQHDDTPSHFVDTSEVYGKMSKISEGNRSVTMGRGVYKNNKVEQYVIPKISAKVEENIEDIMNNLVLKPTRDDVRSYSSKIQLPIETGSCPNCNRTSTYVCCNCKEWYCSMDCVREHIDKYGSGCKRRKMVFAEQEGQYEDGVDGDDYLLDKKYFEKNGQLNSRQPKSEGEENRGKNNRASIGNRNDKPDTQDKPGQRGEGGLRKGGIEGVKNFRNSGTRGTFSDNEDKDSIASSQTKNSDPKRRSGGDNDRQSRLGGRHRNKTQSRQDRGSFGNRNSQHDGDIYVRNENTNSSNSQFSRMVVVCSKTKEDNVFWVYKKSSVEDMINILKSLNALNKSSKTLQPAVNLVCAAPFNNELFRAKILNITNKTAVVRFIDYGNEDNVKLDDLKQLPKELVSKPPLAFKIRVLGPIVKLDENNEIIINVISSDSSGAWKVKIADNHDNSPSLHSETEEHEECSLSYDHFDLVHIMDGSEGEYSVQMDHNLMKLVNMRHYLGKHSSIKVEPQLGEIYVKYYCDTWCRAEITKERPLTVFYIDYGNSEAVDRRELHPLPEEYKNIPPMAIKVKLADGTPQSYFNLKCYESISVKAVDKLLNGTYIVHVKGEKYHEQGNKSKVYQPKAVYSDSESKGKHCLTFVKNGDPGIWICVQKVMSLECFTGFLVFSNKYTDYCNPWDISELLKNIEPIKNYKPKTGDLVIARVGSSWCRGYVMLITDEDVSVALIDYGKVAIVQEKDLNLLPPRFHSYPVRQAVRVVVNSTLNSKSSMIGRKIHLTNIHKKEEIIKCTLEDCGEAEIIVWTPFIEESGLRVIPVKNNSFVVLASFQTPRAVYVRSASKEDVIKFNELLQDVTSYIAKAQPLQRKPLCGELLCAKYSEDGNYYRAQVFQKADDNSAYKVNFVDFGNCETVPITDLFPLHETFKKVPCFAVKVGLKDVVAHAFNPQAMGYLNKLTYADTILALTFDEHLGEVSLAQQDGKVINNAILDLMEPDLKSLEMPSNEHIKKIHPFMGIDVIYEPWPVHTRVNILVMTVQDYKTVLALNQKSSLINHLIKFLTPKITKYCKESDQNSYNPRTNEVVLAKYIDEEDGEVNWYRALCIKAMMSSSYILFIDYGNCGELAHSDIRSMPAQFMDTPACLKRCSIYGLCDSMSNDIKNKLKVILSQYKAEATVIEDSEDGNSTLWMPSLYSKLTSLGHPRIDPPPGV